MVGEIFCANRPGFSDVYSTMLIECTACDAKYRVPDEKVAGKTVRLRCKRCGTGLVVDARPAPPATSEASVMFSLAMLTQQAPKLPAPTPVDDIAHISAGDVFAPLLTAPAVPEPARASSAIAGWVAGGAIALVGAVVIPAVLIATRAPAANATQPVTSTSTSTSTSTVAPVASTRVEPPITSASEHLASPPAPHPRAIVVPVVTASHVAKPPAPPKCCPGETDIECAMRRSVGKACGS